MKRLFRLPGLGWKMRNANIHMARLNFLVALTKCSGRWKTFVVAVVVVVWFFRVLSQKYSIPLRTNQAISPPCNLIYFLALRLKLYLLAQVSPWWWPNSAAQKSRKPKTLMGRIKYCRMHWHPPNLLQCNLRGVNSASYITGFSTCRK